MGRNGTLGTLVKLATLGFVGLVLWMVLSGITGMVKNAGSTLGTRNAVLENTVR